MEFEKAYFRVYERLLYCSGAKQIATFCFYLSVFYGTLCIWLGLTQLGLFMFLGFLFSAQLFQNKDICLSQAYREYFSGFYFSSFRNSLKFPKAAREAGDQNQTDRNFLQNLPDDDLSENQTDKRDASFSDESPNKSTSDYYFPGEVFYFSILKLNNNFSEDFQGAFVNVSNATGFGSKQVEMGFSSVRETLNLPFDQKY